MNTTLTPSADQEFEVPVVFDVYAPSREAAARIVKDVLQANRAGVLDARPEIDCWWFPEQQDKKLDGNDRGAMHLVYSEVGTLRDVADALPGSRYYDERERRGGVTLEVHGHCIVVSDWDAHPGENFLVGLYGRPEDATALEQVEVHSARDAIAVVHRFIADLNLGAGPRPAR
ncbi:hypothetical protein [Cellulomonas sp. HD19AZ1]|uniref:hypothetical protein n=1 Tax=Cellulomonas sp. HD19AZ1 TaxID=2559593 RepID=UPI00107097E3|nr:hypothetical protein [Cellulomonas sp. HD19AZ1]TFH68145.1 hypothetical protein E4A51_18035 [Cellulomonas sp. HD19AZ1]